jgi:hypothetical protein
MGEIGMKQRSASKQKKIIYTDKLPIDMMIEDKDTLIIGTKAGEQHERILPKAF